MHLSHWSSAVSKQWKELKWHWIEFLARKQAVDMVERCRKKLHSALPKHHESKYLLCIIRKLGSIQIAWIRSSIDETIFMNNVAEERKEAQQLIN